MEVQHHPDNHDIDQRNLRMGRLESGVKVVMEWVPREYKIVNGMKVPQPTKEGHQTQIVGRYIMTPEVSQLINSRLDEIYTYTFPKTKSYAVLVYDFILNSNVVINERIRYAGEPDDDTMRNKVKTVIKNKELTGPTLSLTGYEEKDKSKPGSELSDDYRSHYLVMIINRNVATTVMLTSKQQWEKKTFYGVYNQGIDGFIRFDEIPKHATRVERGYSSPKKDDEVKESPVKMSKEMTESWLMEWVNSVKL